MARCDEAFFADLGMRTKGWVTWLNLLSVMRSGLVTAVWFLAHNTVSWQFLSWVQLGEKFLEGQVSAFCSCGQPCSTTWQSQPWGRLGSYSPEADHALSSFPMPSLHSFSSHTELLGVLPMAPLPLISWFLHKLDLMWGLEKLLSPLIPFPT